MKIINPYIVLLIGVTGVSTSAILVKLTTAPPVIIAFYRLLFSFLILAPLTFKYNLKDFNSYSKKQYLGTFLSGLFLALHFISWFSSLAYTSVASSTVLVNTQPIFVVIISYFLWKETFPYQSYIGLFLALTGTIILSWSDFQFGLDCLKGDLLALIGAFFIAGYYLFGRYLRKEMNNLPYITLVYGFSTLLLLLFSFISPYSLTNYPGKDYLIFFSLAFFCTILGHSLLNWALKYLPTASVSISVLGEPVIASFLAFFIYGESLSLKQLTGSTLILLGIYCFLSFQKRN